MFYMKVFLTLLIALIIPIRLNSQVLGNILNSNDEAIKNKEIKIPNIQDLSAGWFHFFKKFPEKSLKKLPQRRFKE